MIMITFAAESDDAVAYCRQDFVFFAVAFAYATKEGAWPYLPSFQIAHRFVLILLFRGICWITLPTAGGSFEFVSQTVVGIGFAESHPWRVSGLGKYPAPDLTHGQTMWHAERELLRANKKNQNAKLVANKQQLQQQKQVQLTTKMLAANSIECGVESLPRSSARSKTSRSRSRSRCCCCQCCCCHTSQQQQQQQRHQEQQQQHQFVVDAQEKNIHYLFY